MEPRARLPQERPVPRTPAAPQREPGWRNLDILRAAALVMGLYLLLRLLWLAHELILITFLGVLFGLAVARGTDYLEKMRIPRGVGATLIVFGFVGALYGLGAWSAPTLREQFGELRTQLPAALDQAEGWLDSKRGGMLGQFIPGGQEAVQPKPGDPVPPADASQGGARGSTPTTATQSPGAAAKPQGETLSGQLGAATRYLFSFLSSTLAVLGGLALVLFLSIYIGAEPDTYQKGMLHLVPHRARPRAAEVLKAIGMTLRRWLVTQLIAMVVIGIITTIALKLLGVKAALSLGLLAGLLEFIPLLGPILSGIPAVAMGFLDSPQKALLVALVYVAIQQVENHLLIPLLMKRGVDLPPAVTLIGLALMSLVFGFLGMLVAVPLLAAVMVAVKLLYVEDVVGDDVETVLDGT